MPTQQVDFDALSRQVREQDAPVELLTRLAGATFALPKWLFIARGQVPNVTPYVAFRADYENGKQMIRCFTDSARLARFAKENNLTAADGTTQLLEIPVEGVVDYLEQFMKEGVYGIWFNSNTESDGFSFPLNRLRPVREYLAKMERSSAPPATEASNLEDYGLTRSGDGNFDVIIKVFRTGNVTYGTAPVSFYTAIVLLLSEYQGTGEYQKIFNFAPEAMQNLQESFGSNTHGNYFRLRTFQYAVPGAVANATTIDSNQLHHIRTGAKLLISFAVLQVQDTSSAALYFGIEGPGSEVRKLQAALAPALEAAAFIESEAK